LPLENCLETVEKENVRVLIRAEFSANFFLLELALPMLWTRMLHEIGESKEFGGKL
jgi:hypothetical protein